MKMFKRIVSLALCLVIFLLLFSCNKTDNNNETTENGTTVNETVSVTEKEKKIPTVKEVAEANLLENLLKRNESVYTETDSDYETTYEMYFMFNSEVVMVCDQTLHEFGEEMRIVTAEYNGMNMLSENGGRFCVRAFVDTFGTEEENGDTPWYNDYISYSFIYDNLSFREETDEFYIFENLNDDPDDETYIQTVCYVEKETLNLIKEVHNNDGYIVEEEFIYNEPLELMHVLDDWNGKMKTVTVVFETYKDGEPVKYTEEYKVPVNWEVIADNNLYDTVFAAYLDEGYTKEYKYPGDGVDYTIYATTSVG